MSWDSFIWFAAAALVCWITGSVMAWVSGNRTPSIPEGASEGTLGSRAVQAGGRRRQAAFFYGLGILVFLSFIIAMWISLERPPLRTLGETRLWYSFFLAVAAFMVFLRWKYKWILSFGTLMALVFIVVNLAKPEIHSKALMPALQSPWFAPHVIVYMFSYGVLSAATLMAVYILFFRKDRTSSEASSRTSSKKSSSANSKASSRDIPKASSRDISSDTATVNNTVETVDNLVETVDNLVATGLAFLTFGMLFGALWAQEAWGNYWAWDPKETWAAVTWLAYVLYIHFRLARPKDRETAMWILLLAFFCLQICWWGINYLPSARATSVHVY